jgi:hypothetical protein
MFDDRQEQERRAAATRASIEHPNLLPARLVRDRRRKDVRLVLKKSSAPRLDEVLATRRPGARDCLRILYDVACAVDALNRHGLVASNLAPSRILVDPRRGGILADPGMPAELNGRPPREDDPEAVYRSPEERAGRPIDVRSNVYSLGVILSTALAGAPPAELRDAPSPMDAVISWATDVDPTHRYTSAEELVFAAADALESLEAARSSAASAPVRAKRRQRAGRPQQHVGKARTAPPRPRPEPPAVRAFFAATARARPNGRAASDPVRPPVANTPRPTDAGRRSRSPGRRLAWASSAVMAAAVLVSAFAGILLARSGGDDPQPSRIASSALTMRLAPGWTETRAPGDTASLLSDPIAAAPPGEDGLAIVAGRARDPVAAARLLSTQGGGPPAGARLGRLETWRYTGLRPGPNLVATGYLAPTTGDPLVVMCRAPRGDARARLPECERMASTITLRDESAVRLSAIEAREKRSQRVMTGLVRRSVAARRRLARARLASQQAEAARGLERIYRRAARDLADTTPALTRSLRATADAYDRLARAAAAVDRSRYRAAVRLVRESEAAVLREAAEPRAA